MFLQAFMSMQAATTLENTGGKRRALRKFSAIWNLSLLKGCFALRYLACEQALYLGLTQEILGLMRDLFWARAARGLGRGRNLPRETQIESLLAGYTLSD